MDSSYQQQNNPPPDDNNNNPNDENNNNNNPSKNNSNKKGKGRQKIPIEKIENETNRQVTFSKRRAGLFKKASELSTLCGAESAIVVFSPGDKVHSFGSPNVETITNRFLNQTDLSRNIDNNSNDHRALAARNDAIMRQQNQLITSLESQVESEKKSKKQGNKKIQKANNRNKKGSSPPDFEELNHEALDVINRFVVSLKQELHIRLHTGPPGNPYVQGSDPAETGIGGGSPATTTTLDGPSIDFTMDPNIRGPSYMATLYNGNQDQAMNTGGNPPFVPCGSSNYPTIFDIGSRSNSSNYAFPNNPGASINPSATFFSDMLTTNNNPGLVDPFDPMADNNFGLPFNCGANPTMAGSLNPMLRPPFNYGNPSNIVTCNTGTEGTSTEEARREGRGRGTQSNVQGKSKGTNNKYSRGRGCGRGRGNN